MMKKLPKSCTITALIYAVAVCLSMGPLSAALAQQPVVTLPQGFTTLNVSGSITATNTFQSVVPVGGTAHAGSGTRHGCLIQNNGSNNMYVFLGAPASGDKTKSFVLIPPAAGVQGGAFSCSTGAGGVVQDQISITGTISDAFTATWQ